MKPTLLPYLCAAVSLTGAASPSSHAQGLSDRRSPPIACSASRLARRLVMTLLAISAALWLTAPCQAGAELVNLGDITQPQSVYIIAVGVNRYAPPLVHQQYCIADAEAVASSLQTAWKSAGHPVDVQLLRDEDLSRASLRKAFAHVASSAKTGDLFVFYYAGLSETFSAPGTTEDEYYLLTSDFVGGDASKGQKPLEEQAIPAGLLKTWCAGIQAKKQLIVLDSCGSRDKLQAFVDQATQSASEQQLNATGVVLLTSEGMALERGDLYHGLLTYALLKGLAGEAMLLKGRSGITAREMEAYLPTQVLRISDGVQVFRSYSYGDDFNIAPLPHIAPAPPAATVPTRQTESVEPPASVPSDDTPARGKNYALIFATDHYDDAGFNRLSNPIHDAQTLADELRRQYGFEAQVVPNPTQDDIYSTLIQYRKRTYNPADQLFIFFAGHGTKGNGDGYIVTRDSKSHDDFFKSYIQYAFLKNALTTFPCPHILLALDVCYGGNFVGTSVEALPPAPRLGTDTPILRLASGETVLSAAPVEPSADTLRLAARLMKGKSRIFLSSGKDEPVPDGAPGGHSPFAQKLLDVLKQGKTQNRIVTAHDVYEEALKTVTEPQYDIFDNSRPDGEFVFMPVTADGPAL